MRQDKKARLGVFPVLLVLVLLSLGAAVQVPIGWHHGWSRPYQVLAGERQSGYDSVPLADGTIILASKRVSGDTNGALVISKLDVQTRNVTTLLELQLQDLREYVLLSDGSTAYVAAVARQEQGDVQGWRLSLYSLPASPGASASLVTTFGLGGIVSDLSVVSDSLGGFYWAWSGSELGPRNIHLYAHDGDGETLLMYEISGSPTVDRFPVLAVDDSRRIYLMYYRDNAMFTELVCQVFALGDGEINKAISLGRASPENSRPILLAGNDGVAQIYWAQALRLPGRAQSAAVYYGEFSHDADGPVMFHPLIKQRGTITRLSVLESDLKTLVWISDRTGSLQIEYAELTDTRNILASGPVTQGVEHRFFSQAHDTASGRVVLFARISQAELMLYAVDDIRPARAPVSYWLGLDTTSPLGDAAFRYVTLLGSSLGLAVLAGMSILFGTLAVLAIVWLLPGANLLVSFSARLLLFSFLAVLKRNGGLLYYGAVSVPGPAGLAITLGSALFAAVAVEMLRAELPGVSSLAVAGYLFVVADFFASLYVGSIGL